MEWIEYFSLGLGKKFTGYCGPDVRGRHIVEFSEVIDRTVDLHIVFQRLERIVHFIHRAKVIVNLVPVVIKNLG